jgi:hypothetical protein
MFKRRYVLAFVLVLTLVFSGVALAAVPITGTASVPVSAGGVTPYIIPGFANNQSGFRTCEEVGQAFFGDPNYYQYSSYSNWDDGWDNLPTGVTANRYGAPPSNVNWSSTFSIGAVLIRGGNDTNVYVYTPQSSGDTALGTPPQGAGGTRPAANQLGLCWNAEAVCEWTGETAWSAGPRYVVPGNWATYTPYDAANAPFSVTLFAGQTMDAGTVSFSAPSGGMVTITITLNTGWRFYDDGENVKIQDYATAPSGNPAPGLFDHKGYATGSSFSIDVPENNFYGVHVDVEWEDCP